MQATILFSMLIFSFSMSISPGPINITILSSSLIYGVKKTLPFISGATIGFTLLLIVTGFGFSKLLILYPFTFKGLAVVGSLFIGYTGYRILSSSTQIQITHPHSAPKFYHGFLLQWLNPKAWIACASGVTLFSVPDRSAPLIIFISLYFLVCYGCLLLWGMFGQKLAHIVTHPTRIGMLNAIMGGALMIVALSMLINLLKG
ncbi:hypothetical protein P255_00383 [Acinetobacter brisouii CIP 110357]|uniref:Uncharacterized protein n=1 Tax=Acinetobacter brisouii CIP 110357 TaxID=1341683 RepID=V2UQG5_9GAMM|nr:LysE family translocator [Acinetobacter brisouii]ENV46244.1 hypothetical protein F954_02223 [Acinetobacter brisouii ANC 4119]ESK52232.1 hypothetical protein P255_00383 [Acinetobacter brisouii CIP 110357]